MGDEGNMYLPALDGRLALANTSDPGGLRGSLSRRGFLAGGAVAAGAVLLSACSPSHPSASTSTSGAGGSSAAPKHGGRLRLGVTGSAPGYVLDVLGTEVGGEILVAHRALVYDTLTWRDANGNVIPALATEFSSNSKGDVWKIRLRDGVKWHDGTPFTANDVAATFQYILNPKNTAAGYGVLSPFMDPQGIKVIDKTTLQLTLPKPYALLQQSLSSYNGLFMCKAGYTPANNPQIGTGPFKLTHFTPGQSALFSRNPDYWGGAPYLDGIELQLIVDASARLSALQSGQLDAIAQIDLTQASTIKADPNLRLLQHKGANWTAQTMHTQTAPFNDNNVRLAFKYMLNRQQVVDTALGGLGRIGNDIPNSFDLYAATLKQIPQRPYDPDKAMSLLKTAGFSKNLRTTLVTADADPGMLTSSQVIAQLGQAVGASIKLNEVAASSYFAQDWLQSTFACTYRGARSLNDWIGNAMWAKAPQNETQWNVPAFTQLWEQAQATLDDQSRAEMYLQLQQQLYDNGGYLIWGFIDNVDAYSSKLTGIEGGLYRNFNFYKFNKTSFL